MLILVVIGTCVLAYMLPVLGLYVSTGRVV